MFRKGKHACLFLLALFVFFSCIQDVTINNTNESPEIVLNCFLDTSKDTVTVNLSYSKPIQSTEKFEAITTASIRLFEEGKNIGVFIWADSSAYKMPVKVKPGKTYQIEAEVGGKTAWAETTVPITTDATIEKANSDSYLNSYLISLKDNNEESNFYWISATGYEGIEENRTKNIACLLYSNFEYADDFNQTIYQNGNFKFEYEFYIRVTNNELPDNKVEVIFSPQCISRPIEVFLLSVDYHLDKYMKSSLILHDMDLYAEDMPIIYSPFPGYSNINGGTGIFGSLNSVSKVFIK